MFNLILNSLVIFAIIFIMIVLAMVITWLSCDLTFGELYYWKKIGKFFVKIFYIILGVLICLCACIVHVLTTGQRLKEAKQCKISKLSKAFLDFKTNKI